MFLEECNSANLEKVINYCRQVKLFDLKITKIQDDLHIEYDITDNLEEDKKAVIEKCLKNNTQKIISLIKHLKELQQDINNEVTFNRFSLSFKYSNDKFLLNSEKVVRTEPKVIPKEIINFDEVFKEEIAENKNVPGIYKKVSSKKYAFVSYKELAEILKQAENNAI